MALSGAEYVAVARGHSRELPPSVPLRSEGHGRSHKDVLSRSSYGGISRAYVVVLVILTVVLIVTAIVCPQKCNNLCRTIYGGMTLERKATLRQTNRLNV